MDSAPLQLFRDTPGSFEFFYSNTWYLVFPLLLLLPLIESFYVMAVLHSLVYDANKICMLNISLVSFYLEQDVPVETSPNYGSQWFQCMWSKAGSCHSAR